MKRILLLVTVALILAAAMALSGVAQAKPIGDSADAQCAKLAIKTLGPSFNPSNYTFIGGTEGNDGSLLGEATEGPDVFCGFGGNDLIAGELEAGDIFLGGAGNDDVFFNAGTVYGGADTDFVIDNYGTFYGEEGNDFVYYNGCCSSTFYGGAGNDQVTYNDFGSTFYGEEGSDGVFENNGTFVQ